MSDLVGGIGRYAVFYYFPDQRTYIVTAKDGKVVATGDIGVFVSLWNN